MTQQKNTFNVPFDNVNWEYADASDGDKTQWGPRIDAVLAEVYRDYVRLNHGGTFRNKFGPEAEMALKYHLALHFLQRPWQLEQVAAGEAESIRDPDQFIQVVRQVINEVMPGVLDAADAASEFQPPKKGNNGHQNNPRQSEGPDRLFADHPEMNKQSSQTSPSNAEPSDSITEEDLRGALDLLERALKAGPEEFPNNSPTESAPSETDQSETTENR